jgi:hypothetical protein
VPTLLRLVAKERAMHYASGHPAHVGDLVELRPGHPGRIVCAPEERDYPDDFPRRDWAWLERGVLIRTATNRLVHLPRLHGLRLLRPAAP